MRVLAAGLWNPAPRTVNAGSAAPGGRGASGAVKTGEKTVDSADGFCYDGLWSKRPISAINGGECSWIAAEVQDEAGYAARRDTDTGTGVWSSMDRS